MTNSPWLNFAIVMLVIAAGAFTVGRIGLWLFERDWRGRGHRR